MWNETKVFVANQLAICFRHPSITSIDVKTVKLVLVIQWKIFIFRSGLLFIISNTFLNRPRFFHNDFFKRSVFICGREYAMKNKLNTLISYIISRIVFVFKSLEIRIFPCIRDKLHGKSCKLEKCNELHFWLYFFDNTVFGMYDL